MSDEATPHLLHSAQRGDDDALGLLLEKYRPMLRAEAMKSLTTVQARVDPSDIVQITWWSAFRGFPRFEGDVQEFIGWLRKIHDRNLKDALRDHLAARRNMKREAHGGQVAQLADGKTTSPSQRASRSEDQQKMENCLNQLPPAQKEAVRLRFYEGLPIAQIVERMGRSETAVAGLLKRGLSRLRELLREESPDK